MAQGHVTLIAFVVSCLGGTLLGEVSLMFFFITSQIEYLMSNPWYVNKEFQIFFFVISPQIELQNLDL